MASNTDPGSNFNLCYSHRPNPPVLTSQRSSWWEMLQWGKHVWSAGENKNIQIIWAIYLSFCPKMTLVLNQWVLNEWVNLCSLLPPRFRKGVFDKNYKATIGVDFEMERFEVLGVPFSLQLWVRRRCANLQTASNRVTRWLFLPIQRRLNNEYEENHMASSCLRSCSSRVASEFLNAAVTLVSESWIKWFAFIKLVFSAQSSACLHLIQFLNVLKGFTVCAQADVHVNLHHSI